MNSVNTPTVDFNEQLMRLPGGSRAAAKYLAPYELPPGALIDLARHSRIRLCTRGSQISRTGRSGFVYILLEGCVAERNTEGAAVRLWRNRTAFGDSGLLESLFSSNSSSRSKLYGEFLSTGRTLSIRKERLRALALNEASVALLLARIGMERASVWTFTYFGSVADLVCAVRRCWFEWR